GRALRRRSQRVGRAFGAHRARRGDDGRGDPAMTVTLVLGGTASGKSSVAERLAGALADDVVYVATGVATDDEMAARIASHKLRRPPSWSTVETDDLPAAVRALPARPALIDSLGTWVAHTPDFAVDADDLLA